MKRPASGDEVAAAVASLRRAADDRARQAEQDRLAAQVRSASRPSWRSFSMASPFARSSGFAPEGSLAFASSARSLV